MNLKDIMLNEIGKTDNCDLICTCLCACVCACVYVHVCAIFAPKIRIPHIQGLSTNKPLKMNPLLTTFLGTRLATVTFTPAFLEYEQL